MIIKAFHADLLGFFDKIPTARIMNKFSNDFSVIEDQFIYAISSIIIVSAIMTASIFIVCVNISPFLIIFFGTYIFILFKIQAIYITIKKDLHRCLNISKTPIVN